MKKLMFVGLLAVLSGAAVADVPNADVMPRGPAKVALQYCGHCGTVQSVVEEKRKGEGGAVGVVGGAVVGGLLGNQVGKGNGKTVATVGGAVADCAGNEVQKHVTSKKVWVTRVRMKDGSLRQFEQEAQYQWKVGGVVKVQGDTLKRL